MTHNTDDGGFDIEKQSIRFRKLLSKISNASAIQHSERSLLDHLIGTWRILSGWNLPDRVCYAGLIHSVYATDSFKTSLFTFDRRIEIQTIAGKPSEQLAFIFCNADRSQLWDYLDSEMELSTLITIPFYNSSKSISVKRKVVDELLILECANFAEQTATAARLPSPWMSWILSRRKQILSSHLKPSFVCLQDTISWDADEESCSTYCRAISEGAKNRQKLLSKVSMLNPLAAEPIIVLAADMILENNTRMIKNMIKRALWLLDIWQTSWDKRLQWHEWIHVAESLTGSDDLARMAAKELRGRILLATRRS